MHLRKAWIWLSVLLLLCLVPGMAGAEGLRGYEKGNGWQYAYFGEYPYEANGKTAPVLWRILEYEDGKLLMVTEYIIDTQQVIFESDPKKIERYEYRNITAYKESDLYTWMNTVALDTLLGDDPARSALIEEPDAGLLFIMDMDDFRNVKYGFSANTWGEQPTRQATGTPYALKARGLYKDHEYGKSCYWVADIKSLDAYRFALVGYNGHLSWGGYTRTNVGIRPSVRLDMSQMMIYAGDGSKDEPFVLVSVNGPYERPAATATPAPQPGEKATPTPVPTATPVPTPTPTPRPTPTRIPNSEGEVLLSFVGNCSIGDSEQFMTYQESYHTTVDEKGYDWIFSDVYDHLAADDLTIANLEAVLTTKLAHSSKMYNLKADPDHVNVLTQGSIEVVNTVNGHCMDFLRPGYLDMLSHLENAGVEHFGSIYTHQEDGFDKLAVKEVKGLRIGFIGLSSTYDSDIKRVEKRARILKEEQGCDLVVVSLNWGDNKTQPGAGQVVFAKEVIDAGADVIWGHHPNVIQPITFYKGKPILFSTGVFTFGTAFGDDPDTGIFQLAFEKVNGEARLTRLQVIPCRYQDGPDYRPIVLVDENDRQAVFKKLMMKNTYAKCVNLPESFRETGVVWFDNGEMLP